MDVFLIIGIIVALATVSIGFILKGINIAILINGEAIIVILIGTVSVVMNSFPKKDFVTIPKLFRVIFMGKLKEDPVEIVKQIYELSQKRRRDGLLSLESKVEELDNRFMKLGLEMVVDGNDPEDIREVLTSEIEGVEERHRNGASIFTTAGNASPTLGVLGAVIGLIGALGNLNDTTKLGESIAAAFIATFYGVFFGYVIWRPFASRLKRKSHEEVANMEIIMEGILAMQEGQNPNSTLKKLLSMLTLEDRKKFEESRNVVKNLNRPVIRMKVKETNNESQKAT